MNSLSENEMVIMNILWEKSPRSFVELRDSLLAATRWQRPAAVAFVTQMVGKGLIRTEDSDEGVLYYPGREQE